MMDFLTKIVVGLWVREQTLHIESQTKSRLARGGFLLRNEIFRLLNKVYFCLLTIYYNML